MADTIGADDADDILYSDVVLSIQDVSYHRWYTKQLVVFNRGGEPWAFYYLSPASELQEDQDRYESDPVPVFRVKPREVTQVTYEPVA